ncbi:glycosyl transferase [Rhizobium sp. RU20A]|uniref:O-linked N-acetylglucosamine transferase, SPINDLY family protein n=1 Tax=Rhizobium sp. RU20A TaxID=1907412 RepID=UPI00165F03E6|nr:glycosyl transferase [Rhizobium sp. RU20A]
MTTALAAARSAYAAGDYIAALTVLSDLLDGSEDAAVLLLLADTFEKLGLLQEAADSAARAADCADPSIEALNRAVTLHAGFGDDQRVQLYGMKLFDRAPDDAANAAHLAASLLRTGETDLARHFRTPLAGSDDPRHIMLAAQLYADEDRDPAVLSVFRKVAALHPDDPFARFKLLSVARNFCDYETIAAIEAKLAPALKQKDASVFEGDTAYSNLLWCGDEAVNRLASNGAAHVRFPAPADIAARRSSRHDWGERLRIGYLSSDICDQHATMRLFQAVLEAHDPERFEVTLYCYTPDGLIGRDTGRRARWGRIVPIGHLDDTDAAATIRKDRIDILVDLKGRTAGARCGILNSGAAPVQVAWLGFPGSTVGVDLDYVIADPIVLPDGSAAHYHEHVCRLPETYQPNDPRHRALPEAASRAELGLPEDRFVFAAFNAQRKISLQTLDIWAHILRRAPRAVLWVMIDGALARSNFAGALQARGVQSSRIVFAPTLDYSSHIARLQAADLGLDTFPYNGHTTTSDKLWAGLPVITLKGTNFASRVTESLLGAIGLPELVLPDRDAFVARAVALTGDAPTLQRYKHTIVANRFQAPLFDAERFCRHLERAFTTMADRARATLPPAAFDVPALPPRKGAFGP